MDNIRSYLNWHRGYWELNREERNLAAILYHVLLMDGNLQRFLRRIECGFTIKVDEMAIYFEYSYLRDLWFNMGMEGGNKAKRGLIYRFLKPSNIDALEQMSVHEFNSYFGAVPSASEEYIQSPGNWSIGKYRKTIADNDEFLKTCRFKWAFNAKPDIVIHTSHDYAICIECKLESGEGVYPTKPSEIAEFRNRNLKPVAQTSLQKYIMENLLGIQTQFVFLVRKQASKSHTHATLLWEDAFSGLDTRGCPLFIREWLRRLE